MSSEERVKAEPCTGAFSRCLVEGDTEESARERKIKRRAIGISIVLQSVGSAALVIAPLFAKPPELVERRVVPIPPYSHAAPRHTNQQTEVRAPAQHWRDPIYAPTNVPARVPRLTADNSAQPPTIPGTESAPTGRENVIGILVGEDSRRQPPPPDIHEKKIVAVGHIDPALLTKRIEPVFPPLARQIRRSGRVELHALIATDGTVQALEAVSGDPLFVSSALEAVKQWRYKPTYLNGQAVEVDTYITVIYTLQ